MDGFCIIRVARSAASNDEQLREALAWQFQATMRRKPAKHELTKDDTLEQSQWFTLHYPVDKDMGIGPEPLSRDVHVIRLGQGATLTVQVTGMVDAVKLAATHLPQLVGTLGEVSGDTTSENQARQRGQSLVDHSTEHLKNVIQPERNFYTIGIANQPVGYQLESILRDQTQQASGSVHIVFPSTRGHASIDHQWQVDFDKRSFESATEEHSADGSVKKRSLSINNGRVICTSDQMSYDLTDADQIPWPISEDYWPVDWMADQQLLDQWMLIRTAYSASPPAWHWVNVQKTSKGFRVMRRPILSVDTNVYTLDEQGQFVSLEGYDFEAAAHSTLALSVQRVPADVVYNHWPKQKNDIAKWIKDHETTNR
ncbi:MAG TPA: hypothetical protein DCM28_03140 [Phycisphaerales bacterium]|nr:hypothetical protein [Phycisphaerales bacterium]